MPIEFFNYESEVWFRDGDGQCVRLSEDRQDVVTMLLDTIEELYPDAAAALAKEYERCKPNIMHFRFRMALRFCKCNFGAIDRIPDVDDSGKFNFEDVPCPMRGECRCEGVVCHPKFNHRISDAEMRVMRLWYDGVSKPEIAERLFLSVHTVCNHIRRAYERIGAKDKAEFVRYADRYNLFH